MPRKNSPAPSSSNRKSSEASSSSRNRAKPRGSSRKSRQRTRSRSVNQRNVSRRGSSSSSSEPQASRERRTSKSTMCNLDFPVARVKTMLKVKNHGLRVSDNTAVFLASVLEYMTHEILELSLNVTREDGRSRILPRHVNKAIKMDRELFKNFKNSSVVDSTFIPFGYGVIPDQRTVRHRAEDPSIPGPSGVTTPISSRKPDSRGVSRREG